MVDVQEMISTMQDVASVKRVYSDPYEKDGVTVVPAGPSHQGEWMYEPITVKVDRGYGEVLTVTSVDLHRTPSQNPQRG